MAKIEKAALAAYEKDLKKMDDGGAESYVDTQPAVKVPNNNIPEPKAKTVKSSLETVQKKIEEKLNSMKSEEPSPPTNVWYEAVTDEGHKYYWNSESSESQWEAPEEGFVSLEEQNQMSNENSENTQVGVKVKSKSKKSKTASEQNSSSMGPQPKVEPYGQWVTVENEQPVEYDLQLPEQSEHTVEVVIPLHKEENSLKFKEKVVGKLSDDGSSEVTFKKRKFTGCLKRNARQRTTDDD